MSVNVTLKGVPDSLHLQLKKSAAAHHRSLNGEILYRLEQSLGLVEAETAQTDRVSEEWPERERTLRAIEDLRAFGKDRPSTSVDEVLAMIREGRR